MSLCGGRFVMCAVEEGLLSFPRVLSSPTFPPPLCCLPLPLSEVQREPQCRVGGRGLRCLCALTSVRWADGKAWELTSLWLCQCSYTRERTEAQNGRKSSWGTLHQPWSQRQDKGMAEGEVHQTSPAGVWCSSPPKGWGRRLLTHDYSSHCSNTVYRLKITQGY